MPQVVNGCGTWYYGKKNLQRHSGVCGACKSATTLSSYDTRLYVVVFFIPIVPLGRKHIIDECAACRRHGAMPMADWQTAQRRSQQTLDNYQQRPTDAKLAEEAVTACVGYRDLPAFLKLAPEIEKNLAGDVKTLCMLAAVYDLFGRISETERLLRAVLTQKDEPETRELLADCLLRQGRPAEAEPYLQHIVQQGIPDRVDALYQLAQGYQLKGEHEKALVVFQQCEMVNPLINRDATFQRLRDTSATNLGTGRVVKPEEVVRKARSAQARRRFFKVAPVVVLLGVLAYLALAWIQGTRCKVHLVNGLDRPYTVRLNGAEHTLQPQSITPVRLAEGEVEVEIADSSVPPERVPIATPLWSRPFASHTFVINPDRSAILQILTVVFVPHNAAGGAPPPRPEFTTGQTLQYFRGIDYPFDPVPESIQLDSSTKLTTRKALSVLGKEAPLPGHYLLLALSKELGNEPVAQAAQRRLLLEPERGEYMHVLDQTMNPQDLAAFLRPRLADRPLRMDWHRAYLTAMEKAAQDQQALREYEAMLAADSENKDLMYLLGRICGDPDRSLSLCQKAAAGDSPSAFAIYSLCNYYLSNGRFHEAAQHADRVLNLLPDDDSIRGHCRQAFLADGQFEKLQGLLRQEQAGAVFLSLAARAEECYLLTLQGKKVEAEKAVEELRGQWTRLTPAHAQRYIETFQAQLQYAQGHADKFATTLAQATDAGDRLAGHLTGGDLAAAEKDLEGFEPQAQHHLLVYLVAMRHKKQDVAERQLKKAIGRLAQGDFVSRAFGQALEDKPPMPLEKLIRLRDAPAQKAVLLVALGLHDPKGRDACFALARKLNFDRRYPYLLLKEVLDAPPAR